MAVVVPKLHAPNWKAFYTEIEESLSCTSEKNDIPLSYIIREAELGNSGEACASRSEKLKYCVML